MDTIHRGIITLLKSAITGEKLSLPEGFDIEKAYAKIKSHHVIPLAYTGAVNCGIDQSHPVMHKLFQGYLKAMQISQRQMRDLRRVFEAFEEQKIDFLPLKGCNMKEKYPRPELRMMGDADILIREKQYKRIKPIMSGLGFQEGIIGPQHVQWESSSLCVELHNSLFGKKETKVHDYFKNPWSYAKPQRGTRYAMSEEDMLVYQFAHFARHYRSSGIGCRHVTDLWVFFRSYPNLNEAIIREKLEKMRLWTFFNHIRRLIDVWFENAEADDQTEFITRSVFTGGSWGSSRNHVLSESARRMGSSDSVFKAKLKYLRETFFPGLDDMRYRYSVLHKAPYLLPVMWFVRIFSRITTLSEDIKKQRNMLHTLNEPALLERKRALEYVGLMDEK
ncbi:MAG: nucleotidyltransferase family protein [Clostridia bacterium]|nr:nucleotidyltransferase family protein [Clostridia bacterium]